MHDAILWERMTKTPDAVRCLACSHYCVISQGKRGVCGVRENRGGKLVTLVYGKVIGRHPDPIEKKPLYHFLPGSKAYSFGTVGCNFHCEFCQNADMSQASKPAQGGTGIVFGERRTPEQLVEEALGMGCASVAYTYNEPAVFIELAHDTMRLAKENGLRNVFVSNGYESEEALDTVAPYLDAMNIDLKAFDDRFYTRTCGGRLAPVLDTIRRAHGKGIWIEITTLVIPGENDGDEELRKIARFIASVDKSIPWHLSRFFPMHRMLDAPVTPMATLERAYRVGKDAGLENVYIGNIGEEGYHDTLCPRCGAVCVRRHARYGGTEVLLKRGRDKGLCPGCDAPIAGHWWSEEKKEKITKAGTKKTAEKGRTEGRLKGE